MHTYKISFTCGEDDVAPLVEAIEDVLRGYREAVPRYEGDTECLIDDVTKPFAA